MVEGNEVDLHNAHWHGNTLLRDGHRVDQCAPAWGRARIRRIRVPYPTLNCQYLDDLDVSSAVSCSNSQVLKQFRLL